MSARVGLVWGEEYIGYDFGPDHPLKPVRVLLTIEMIRACGLMDLPNVQVRRPRPATRAELETIHTAGYIDAITRIGHSRPDPYGDYGWGIGQGDNPAFADMHEASSLVAGGAVVAAEMLLRGEVEHTFNPAGGLHHAMADKAWGFCIYNDPAIAIRTMLDSGISRVAYVDVDVHHGDGVQAAFYDDPRVLTISLHESGRYLFPGTGFVDEVGRGDAEGTKVNVELFPYTDHDAYRAAFERVVPPLIQSFKPEILVTQLGCDTHATDPLAHLALTTSTYRWLAQQFHQMAHDECDGRWFATGGGGYQIYAVVPRAWTIYFAELAGGVLPDAVPAEWIDIARHHGASAKMLPARFLEPAVSLSDERAENVVATARASAEATARRIFPYHGLRA